MATRVFLVDGHAYVREALAAVLHSHDGVEVVGEASGVRPAMPDLLDCRPDVIVLDVQDQHQGVQDVADVIRQLPGILPLAMSLDEEWEHASRLLDAGARGYVLKDAAFEELPCAIQRVTADGVYISSGVRRSADLITQVNDAISAEGSTAEMVCQVIEMRDPLIAHHQRRVAELASAIAEDLGLCPGEVSTIRHAALVHDVGELGVPVQVLDKPGSLVATEADLVHGHCEAGYLVLCAGNLTAPIPEIVLQHHERCDGSGYPRGLAGDEILPEARILAVADVVEAMLSRRPYRAGRDLDDVLDEIESGAGIFYDAAATASCLRLFRTAGFTFSVAE